MYSPAPTGDEFVQKMTIAARLINANLGFRVLDVGLDGFDTHDNQTAATTPTCSTQLDTGLATFFSTLDPAYHNRVTVMTMSEFGRTPYSNDSARHRPRHGQRPVRHRARTSRAGTTARRRRSPTIDDQWDRFDDDHSTSATCSARCIDGWMGGGGIDDPQRAVSRTSGSSRSGPAIRRRAAASRP